MMLVGLLIGMVASMFILGGRTTGLLWSMGLGAATYGISAVVVSGLGGSVLMQWVVAIVASSVVLVGYILWRNARADVGNKDDGSVTPDPNGGSSASDAHAEPGPASTAAS